MHIFGREESIILQTRKRTNITNFQSKEISQVNRNYFNKIEKKHPRAEKRSNPSGLYNCHGMVFASKRCFIENPSDILIILSDDEYKEISIDQVLPGDVVIYFSGGDVEHSGIVIEKPKPPLYVPRVISKWACHAEFIHYFNDCPYDCSEVRYYRIFE